MRMVLISLLAVALLGVGVMLLPQNGQRADRERTEAVPTELPVFGNVGSFDFVNQEGEGFSSKHLGGKVWLAGFVFTSCAAECPILTRSMLEVRERLGRNPEAAFVSFSVDPQTDSPERLKAYASDYGSTADWTLLTGDPEALDTLIKGSFLLPVAENYHERQDIAAAGFIHSNKLVVVDRTGAIRYFADGMEADAVERLTEAMRRLM